MTLKADDGTPLEAKEGIVLDQQGQPLANPRSGPEMHIRTASFSLPFPAILGGIVFVPIALATGFAFFVVIAVLLALFLIISTVSKFLRNP